MRLTWSVKVKREWSRNGWELSESLERVKDRVVRDSNKIE